jgi:hypothetical protein
VHPSTTRAATRRKRLRQERPSVLSRKENLKRGRLQKASNTSLPTQAEISRLKPGLKFKDGEAKVYTLKELFKQGFKRVPWNGTYVSVFSSSKKTS